ncbi:MAG: cysteine-rich small domain-containing protein [Promethearchaeota archaeon]
MHKKGTNLIKIFLIKKELLGKNKLCKFLPCHEGLEDCTFCFCPFYPCEDESTSGRYIVSKKSDKKVWSCINCIFPNLKENVQEILKGLCDFRTDFSSISREQLLKLRKEIIKKKVS